ncbi:hypothetical protein [Peribacillus frigoritolerans]|uniref:hypothetical protein n=1 Tax=Peribacillus castrilensis TaxID=2897690 RepID=UPI00296F1DDC|nr:hypothetical protein [Peribacillus castrilensis]
MADSRRKGSGFLKSTGTYLKLQKLIFLQVCLKSEPKSIFDFGFFFWAVICHIQQTVQLVEEGGIIRLVAE